MFNLKNRADGGAVYRDGGSGGEAGFTKENHEMVLDALGWSCLRDTQRRQ